MFNRYYRLVLTIAINVLVLLSLLISTEVLLHSDYASRKLIELALIVSANICLLILTYSVGLETKFRKILFIVAMFMSIAGVFECLYLGEATKHVIITTAIALNIFNGCGFNKYLKICFLGAMGITNYEFESLNNQRKIKCTRI